MDVNIFHFDGQRRDERHYTALRAFHKGCLALGINSRMLDIAGHAEAPECDFAVVFGTHKEKLPWSIKRRLVMERQAETGGRTVVIDSGYVNREHYYMVGLDGLNGRADFRLKPEMPGDRWEALGVYLLPERRDEETNKILLCGQVPWDASVQYTNHLGWLKETASILKKATDRLVIFQRHPLVSKKDCCVPGVWNVNNVNLDFWIVNCHATVSFNSNVTLDSVIRGVPGIVFDKGSMSWGVAGHGLPAINDLENLRWPGEDERRAWANRIAYCQWTLDEMASGQAVRHILETDEFGVEKGEM